MATKSDSMQSNSEKEINFWNYVEKIRLHQSLGCIKTTLIPKIRRRTKKKTNAPFKWNFSNGRTNGLEQIYSPSQNSLIGSNNLSNSPSRKCSCQALIEEVLWWRGEVVIQLVALLVLIIIIIIIEIGLL